MGEVGRLTIVAGHEGKLLSDHRLFTLSGTYLSQHHGLGDKFRRRVYLRLVYHGECIDHWVVKRRRRLECGKDWSRVAVTAGVAAVKLPIQSSSTAHAHLTDQPTLRWFPLRHRSVNLDHNAPGPCS